MRLFKVFSHLLESQTRASFDYQWTNLSTGSGLLSDGRFRDRVAGIIASQELCVDPAWLKGREVLDAGCGNGRWSYGFLQLGARVTAFDQSPGAIATVRASDFGSHPNLRAFVADIYDPPPEVRDRRYDLVWCWGVLHRISDTARAINVLATELMKEDGLLYMYIYGKASYARRKKIQADLRRYLLAAAPFELKARLLRARYGPAGAHTAFDRLSPLINRLFTFAEVEGMCRRAGLTHVERTIEHTELLLRAYRDQCSARDYFTPKPRPPYWFQQMTHQ